MSLSKFAVPVALLTLVHALPQKPDFAAIAAAPTVASGPTLFGGEADQTASLFTSFAVTGAATAPSSASATAAKRGLPIKQRDQTISSDVTDSSYNGRFGRTGELTTVNSGVTYWINGGSTHNFFGNINNNGRIVVSQTGYLRTNRLAGGQTSDWVGHDANNGNLNNAAGALIQLNDYGSASAPTYDWYIRSMQNKGTIQWCGRGDTGGSTFQMYNDLTSTNDGLISFEQFTDNMGASFVWRNPTLTTTSTTGQKLYNNGAFRIINVNYHNVQNVYGTGCWQIGKGGILYLEDGTGTFQNPTAGPSFPGQSVSFKDSTAILHMDTAVYSRNSNFGAQVFGYGQGNAIEFYQIISTFTYNAGSGTLNVTFVGGYQVNIRIGSGYEAARFAKKNNRTKYANYNAIFYDGPAPSQSMPSQCGLSAPVCSDLKGGFQQSTTTTSSTASRTSCSTSSAVVTSTTASSTGAASSTSSSTSSAAPSTSSSTSSVASSTSSSTSSAASSTSSSTSSATSSTSSSTSSAASSTSSSTSSTSTSTSTTPAATPSSCPALGNGATVGEWKISCATDFYGGDLSNTPSPNFAGCIPKCDALPGCLGFSYVGGNNAGVCYFKSSQRGSSPNSGVDSAFRSAPATPPTSSTTTSTVSRTSSFVTSTISGASTTAPPSTTQPPTTPKSCPNTPYTPYYAALATSYTTDPALSATRTTTAGQACVTQPEAGTYCGFLNPLDPCAPQPDGFGPVPTPDTPEAFLAYDRLHASASAAPSVVPSVEGTQYKQVFKNLNAATSAQSYLGLYTLDSYDTAECAAKCDCTELCTSFNLYAERSPSLNPTNNDSNYDPGYPTLWGQTCPNPASMTTFKCTLWGSNIDASLATNTGETRSSFKIVVTASNGYDKTDVTTPVGSTQGTPVNA